MRGRPLRLAAPGALLVIVAVTACANLPTSGNVNLKTLGGAGGSGQLGVQVTPEHPHQGWLPEQIVRGFLAASASNDFDHAVAREYLTEGKNGYGRRWRPGWAATIIDSPAVVTNSPLRPVQQAQGGPNTAQVYVSGRHVEQLLTAGRYQAGSVVVAPASTQFRFSLIQVRGQWRIDNVFVSRPQRGGSSTVEGSRTLLLMSQNDFDRYYQPRNLYFYPTAATQTSASAKTLVPDPVFIPQQVGRNVIKGLVKTLINPPTPASWLSGAATTAFPHGTKLLGAQVTGGITAVVNLGGAAARAGPAQRQRMAAQLYLSLTSSPPSAQAPNPIRSVVLQINGRTVPQPPLPTSYSGWVPRAVAASLYYQIAGSPVEPAVASIGPDVTRSVPVRLPTGLGREPFTQLAVSPAQDGPKVLAGCVGKTVYLISLARDGGSASRRLPSPCTSLSWDDNGSLWVAAQSQFFEIPGAVAGPPARPALNAVFVATQLSSSVFKTLRVAPDGVRVAMIGRTGSVARIQIAAISRNNAITYLAQSNQTLRVGSDVADPVGLTWLDPDRLLVLGRLAPGRKELFEVPLNGGRSTPIVTPHGVKSVWANWPGGPLSLRIVVAIAPTHTSPGKIEQATTPLPNPDWEPLVKGTTPVFPG